MGRLGKWPGSAAQIAQVRGSPGSERAAASRTTTTACASSDQEVLERIRALGIPPAWNDVWICPHPNGHLQATGIDAAGRKQYRYHEAWRTRRDAEKFDDMTRFARALPRAARARRGRPGRDGRAHPRARAGLRGPAARPRVLPRRRRGVHDVVRAGHDPQGAREASTDGQMIFDYPAKSGQRRIQGVVDPLAIDIVCTLKRRRGGGAGPARLQGTAASGTTCAPTTSTSTSRTPPATTSPPRTSGPGAPPCWPRSRSPSPAPRRAPRPRASARSPARSRRPRATSATRPRSAARPTSTRASSTPTTPASCSTTRSCSTPPSPASCRRSTREIEHAVLDLLNEKEESPRIEKLAA